MSRLAPDIPELHGVPENCSIALVRERIQQRAPIATDMADRSDRVCLRSRHRRNSEAGQLFGGVGAVLGAAIGASASIWCFFKVIVPWRARRILPSIIEHADDHTLDQVRHADESLRRMLKASNGTKPVAPTRRRADAGQSVCRNVDTRSDLIHLTLVPRRERAASEPRDRPAFAPRRFGEVSP